MKSYKNILRREKFYNADYVMKYGMMIGCHHGLGFGDIKKINTHINNFISKFE
jgi:hypothetical protein